MRLNNILIVFTLFIFSTFGVSQSSITVEKIWNEYQYIPNRIAGFNFMKDGRHYTKLENNIIVKYDLTTGEKVDEILDGNNLNSNKEYSGRIGSYEFSDDEKLIIVKTESEPIYRRSTKAYFYIYDRESEVLKTIFNKDKISFASLSQDGSKVAYVYQNNIYYLDLETNERHQVTTDGKYNEIINGAADWVYEEEFSFAQAFFWSPDGQKIAYQKFDERAVPEFTLTNYRNNLYPEYVTFKYPKVGEKNAIVSVKIYDLKSEKTVDADIDDSEDHYIPRIKWTNDANRLFVYKLNRHQNKLELLNVNTSTGEVSEVFKEKNKFYIDISDDIHFLEDNKSFIWSSEKSGYNHLYLYEINGEEKNAITKGDFDVTNFYGYDEKNKCIYYQAAKNSPLERQIYKVGINGKKDKIVVGTKGTNNAQFSSTFDYYVNNYSNINTPATYNVYDRNNELVRTLENNENLKSKQLKENVQPVTFFNFTTKDNVDLNGWMIKPKNFDENGQYPVFMYLYGGPGSQQVTDSWKGQNYWWFQMLAQQGYVVACVDNRGTGGRGENFRKMTYMQLGHFETIDQIEAAKYLGSLPYTDKSRIGIFGWSYGGYMSSLCLLKGNDTFKAAIAVAPVTNWRWYDTVYTERFMRTEKENPEGYANNSPINFADRLKGHYLLVHGMGDDNVHFQNSAEMANALIKANKQFDTYYYPNRHHGISGDNARLHLYTKMTDFLKEKL
ncbi:MAG: S9 family peptidase [Saprospiraceae bacterium]|nr:S9 family peptidase [Bacteroidia bacterium]NNE15649.1 S9 family peptidase [Saprospiraceae bacterium]